MKWSLTSTCRKVGTAPVAFRLWAKKTFQLASSLLDASEVPYQTTPMEPGVGPVSIHGSTDVLVSGPSLTRMVGLQFTPLSFEYLMFTFLPSEKQTYTVPSFAALTVKKMCALPLG